MFGLILSKSAAQYASLAIDAGIADNTFVATDAAEQFSTNDKKHATWLLAEPSLALSVLDDLPQLHWLQSTWAGIEPLVKPSQRCDYTLTNVRGVFAPLMSEYVLAYCLAHERRILIHHDAQTQKRWLGESSGTIRGKTMLVLGVGSIGQGIAQTAQFMGMRTLGVVNTPRDIAGLNEVGTFADLPHFLPQADYVVNVLPNTPNTQDIIDAAFLGLMKPSAVLINVGRGQAVVEEDLAAALLNETIAGAVLDVYRIEPLPENHVFWVCPNLTLTSHTAAPSVPSEVFEIFIKNYRLFNNNQPLIHTVDFIRGY